MIYAVSFITNIKLKRMKKMRDPYFYDDCDVLKNKLGIKDQNQLDIAEIEFSCNAIHELAAMPLEGKYDFNHFCALHSYIFKDLYEWVGEPRTVSIEKEESVLGFMSIEYAKPSEIENSASLLLKKMNEKDWEGMTFNEKAENLSNDLSKLWKIHAFREGNTRTAITFICQFADSKKMFMDRMLFEKNSAYMRQALVAASAVFKDCDLRKPEYLYKIMKDSLQRGINEYQKLNMNNVKSKIKKLKESDKKNKINISNNDKER